ncbi:MAG: NAD(P)/FAD-dependent oxidoreductase [Deltaproteobacteria bacterium]|nr:NAD(P)/FAD-dependent oxidoreductase [Deltaproteobacteria bacterium]
MSNGLAVREELFDVAVIGAGFGGLGAALTLAEQGQRVVLFEALKYPGGCASTFSRGGYRFESGATLFSGFAPGQPFAKWIERHQMEVTTRSIAPMVQLRTSEFVLDISSDRDSLIDSLCALPGVPAERCRAFFDYQRTIADVLWSLLDDPTLLPPFRMSTLMRHVARVPRYAALLRCIGRPLAQILKRFGLENCTPLRHYLDAVLQITVQASSEEAEAPFALATMDYYFRGTVHVHHGIGALAQAMVDACTQLGTSARMADAVHSVRREGIYWRITTRKSNVLARHVVANVLPSAAASLLGQATPRTQSLQRAVDAGWSAIMLYLAVTGDRIARREAHHLELVLDPRAPFVDGNHVFLSISGEDEPERAPHGQRTITCSTHVAMSKLRGLDDAARAQLVASIQDQMRQTLAARAPEISEAIVHELTASPRTFERFTRRPEGLVGGVPRRAGLAHYRHLGPMQIAPHVWLVGDSVFPGQSTLATAIGGMRVAAAIGARSSA